MQNSRQPPAFLTLVPPFVFVSDGIGAEAVGALMVVMTVGPNGNTLAANHSRCGSLSRPNRKRCVSHDDYRCSYLCNCRTARDLKGRRRRLRVAPAQGRVVYNYP
ncbi:hypothetical protein Cob_v000821 [Colletotrichum orbiculare MAFF 240422]|uniref:Uncharacterized protein n=1 Tax=Colletotrichum orbiculare (strain 104-T / ATCC 96160 / CBS 514.97 / LARS 414 / MAFF 240422) TaxID=1213857 RepID=A0A484G9S0_COLOR|nr:hypothetical protein Cob_v000821 [Colletotrichum orbiculare MAFF 240422]